VALLRPVGCGSRVSRDETAFGAVGTEQAERAKTDIANILVNASFMVFLP
jgi:hypothetical protein